MGKAKVEYWIKDVKEMKIKLFVNRKVISTLKMNEKLKQSVLAELDKVLGILRKGKSIEKPSRKDKIRYTIDKFKATIHEK